MSLGSQHILFDEILDFLASTPTPQEIIAFQPSEELQNHASELLNKNRECTISIEGKNELDEFQRMNHFMTMLKARARQKLTN